MIITETLEEEQTRTHFITAVEEQDESDVRFAVHDLRPALQVILVPREAVDEEAEPAFVFLHGLLHRLQMAEQEKRQQQFYHATENPHLGK